MVMLAVCSGVCPTQKSAIFSPGSIGQCQKHKTCVSGILDRSPSDARLLRLHASRPRPHGSKSNPGGGLACQASPKPPSSSSSPEEAQGNNNWIFSLVVLALWIGLSVYAFTLSPNQTPFRDTYYLKRLIGLEPFDPDIPVNQVFTALFNVMGIYPAIYASVLVPAGRSSNKVPAWPFIVASFFFGAFALLPYFVVWQPPQSPQKLPPPKEELEGWNKLFMKGAETLVLPGLLLVGALYYSTSALLAGGDEWAEFLKQFDESRFCHVTSLDFLTLTCLLPFWLSIDAQARDWDKRDQWLPLLSVIPVVGPALYLVLRPKADLK